MPLTDTIKSTDTEAHSDQLNARDIGQNKQ